MFPLKPAVALLLFVISVPVLAQVKELNMDNLDSRNLPPADTRPRLRAIFLCIEPRQPREKAEAPMCQSYTKGFYRVTANVDYEMKKVHAATITFSTTEGDPEEWTFAFGSGKAGRPLTAGHYADALNYQATARPFVRAQGLVTLRRVPTLSRTWVSCFDGPAEFTVLEADFDHYQGTQDERRIKSFAAEFRQTCDKFILTGAVFYNSLAPNRVIPPKAPGERLKFTFGNEVITEESTPPRPTTEDRKNTGSKKMATSNTLRNSDSRNR